MHHLSPVDIDGMSDGYCLEFYLLET